MKEIIIATKNKGKAEEFKAFFKAYGIVAKSLLDLADKLPDVEETGKTFRENAALKAEQIADILGCPVLSDDSGLVIDSLDGRPGVYSARFAGENATDDENIDRVLEELSDIPLDERTARFVSILAVKVPGEETIFAEGRCEGHIGLARLGTDGFGYDPVFIPEGYIVTMATLTLVQKNRISHRKHALQQLEKWIKS